jgi:hypothetical protein
MPQMLHPDASAELSARPAGEAFEGQLAAYPALVVGLWARIRLRPFYSVVSVSVLEHAANKFRPGMAIEEEIADRWHLDISRMDHRPLARKGKCRNPTRPSPTLEGYGQGARNRSRSRAPYAAGSLLGWPKPAR